MHARKHAIYSSDAMSPMHWITVSSIMRTARQARGGARDTWSQDVPSQDARPKDNPSISHLRSTTLVTSGSVRLGAGELLPVTSCGAMTVGGCLGGANRCLGLGQAEQERQHPLPESCAPTAIAELRQGKELPRRNGIGRGVEATSYALTHPSTSDEDSAALEVKDVPLLHVRLRVREEGRALRALEELVALGRASECRHQA